MRLLRRKVYNGLGRLGRDLAAHDLAGRDEAQLERDERARSDLTQPQPMSVKQGVEERHLGAE